MSYLSLIVFLPLIGALVIALLPSPSGKQVKWIAALFTLVVFVLSLAMALSFRPNQQGMQFVERADWIPQIGIHYFLGVDGISLPLVVLTAFLGIVAVLISWKVEVRPKEFFIWLLVLETGILGVFTALDLVLFFLFWEVELIPMYMLISIWGTGRKEYSAIKFVTYTILGSALMLAGILALYFMAGSFDMVELAAMKLGTGTTLKELLPPFAVFFLLFSAFAIKLPIFPLHTWLPDAHTDAPTAVSVILAGILLKMGGYGIIRLNVSLLPDVAHAYAPILVAFAAISVLYGAVVTLRQTDLKRLIAYSSVSHMGYVLLGIFALSTVSVTGAVLQMVSHGLITGLLFAMVGLVYEKTHMRDINRLGGLARQMPIIAVVFSVAGLAALGLPGTSGFAAEFLVFVGSFSSKAVEGIQLYTVLGALGIVIAAGYILWMLQRAFYGPTREQYEKVPDAGLLERVPIFALTAVIILVGVYPALVTDIIKVGVEALPLIP